MTNRLSTLGLRDQIARGAVSAADVASACLERIRAREDEVQAWAFLDEAHAMRQAEALDRHRKAGRPLGPLHGLPVGIKDIIDTADMPTANGSPVDAGRRPRTDAVLVSRLRAAGAVILGKAETTELAFMDPTRTRNPHDPARTPGGSSSGSAAAVGAGMVPLAVGTQTGGSVIRPASFCGVYGFKPSHGLIPRTGGVVQAHELDTIGTFATDLGGAALLAGVMAGFDEGDTATRPVAVGDLVADATTPSTLAPTFAFVRSPVWDQAEETTKQAFAELTDALGERCDAVDLPDVFGEAHPAHRTVMTTGFARNLGRYLDRAPDAIGPHLRAIIEEGRQVLAADYLAARDWQGVLNAGLDRIFDRYDAIITPATTGEAPVGLETTGNPVFCAMWTFCGVPALSLPLMTGPAGLPLGVQLVGRKGAEGRLLRSAAWLLEALSGESEKEATT